ncbi:exoenzyme S synthesis protein B [Labilibacter sediminis]|nr:exoenzyme S synthesis protein B [Labilibacter sediminis]
MDKLNLLVDRLKRFSKVYLMFSGGLDSCAILGAAKLAHTEIVPVWINNGFGRADEQSISQQAKNMGNNDITIINVIPNSQVVKNPEDRCYYCKNQIISAIKEIANGDVIIDGTTGSDTGYRPGKKALNENRVISPLADLEISSTEARQIALSLGADKTIADLESCMATRVNYKVPLLNDQLLKLIEIERLVIDKIRDYNIRCRLDDADHVRIEFGAPESYVAISDKNFRETVMAMGEKIALFTTVDLKPSRPNTYDKRITL